MEPEQNKAIVRDFMERAFGQGDLSAIDATHALHGIDHQEPLGTDFIAHLKQVVVSLRTAFPDLHFDIHDMVAEGDIVAFRSTMTGTHLGPLQMGPAPAIPPTGKSISVPHMHFVRMAEGRTTDLWHVWNMPQMMRQLGVMAPRTGRS